MSLVIIGFILIYQHGGRLTSIHLEFEELDLWHAHWLTFGLGETVALVMRLRHVDWVYLTSGQLAQYDWGGIYLRRPTKPDHRSRQR